MNLGMTEAQTSRTKLVLGRKQMIRVGGKHSRGGGEMLQAAEPTFFS
jgi:hypothetical protein